MPVPVDEFVQREQARRPARTQCADRVVGEDVTAQGLLEVGKSYPQHASRAQHAEVFRKQPDPGFEGQMLEQMLMEHCSCHAVRERKLTTKIPRDVRTSADQIDIGPAGEMPDAATEVQPRRDEPTDAPGSSGLAQASDELSSFGDTDFWHAPNDEAAPTRVHLPVGRRAELTFRNKAPSGGGGEIVAHRAWRLRHRCAPIGMIDLGSSVVLLHDVTATGHESTGHHDQCREPTRDRHTRRSVTEALLSGGMASAYAVVVDLSERQENAVRHPWELARRDFFCELVTSDIAAKGSAVDILDVGSGDSWFASELVSSLHPGSTITCWDINYTGDDLCAPLPPGLARTTARPTRDFDVILMLDVLEHIDNDDEFLRHTALPLLRPGGTLFFSVPAHQWLYSSHDTALGHRRRYRPKSAAAMLARYVTVDQQGSLFTSLLPLRAVMLATQKIRQFLPPRSDPALAGVGGWTAGRTLTRALTFALAIDARAGLLASSSGVHVPGLSYWAVCRKPTS